MMGDDDTRFTIFSINDETKFQIPSPVNSHKHCETMQMVLSPFDEVNLPGRSCLSKFGISFGNVLDMAMDEVSNILS